MCAVRAGEGGRYQRLWQLGAGAKGVVYAVFDRERQHAVALKTLRRSDPESLYRLKAEFRQLADLRHDNLVRLYDLVVEGQQCFFTMEQVEGVDFVGHCRGSDGRGYDRDRLSSALSQLTAGLVALHGAGKVHRDIKPGNVLVTPSGRVVILDFGLVTAYQPDATASEAAVGTVAYMAPEQAALGGEVGPAADFYAVGVMLYEVLSGRRPFSGSDGQVLRAKRSGVLEALPDSVESTLGALCLSLLQPDPARRAGAQAIHEALSLRQVLDKQPSAPLFVGRTQPLQRLLQCAERAAGGEPTTVLVQGESGIGKSALLRQLVLQLGKRGALVLQGRCLQREHVPYKAIDGLIDELSQHWRRLPATEAASLVPQRARPLLELFPVLSRVSALAEGPTGRDPEADAQERRLQALEALREVLNRLGQRSLTVLLLDDLQWADADTLSLLRALLQPPEPPPVLMLLAARPGAVEVARLLSELPRDSAQLLQLGALAQAEAQELAASLLGGGSAEHAAWIASEAHGSPFFIERLARDGQSPKGSGARSLERVLAHGLQELPEAERVLLQVASIAGEPLPATLLASAAGLAPARAAAGVEQLLDGRLLRHAQGPLLEPYHDRIREAVLTALPEERQRALCAATAQALDGAEGRDEASLARLWLGAGERAKAYGHARAAADAAMRELAFERAARLYEECLSLGPVEVQCELHELAADALADAGRGVTAAEHYLAAVRGTPTEHALQLQHRAAAQLLWSGHIDEGIRAIEPVLRARGFRVPKSVKWAAVFLVATEAWLKVRFGAKWFNDRVHAPSPTADLEAVELCWSVFHAFVHVDQLLSVSFHAHHLRLSCGFGLPGHVAKALGAATQRATSLGASADVVMRAADDVARSVGDELLRAEVDVWLGGAPMLGGDLISGVDRLAVGERTLLELGKRFSPDAKQAAFRLNLLLYQRGRLSELRDRVRKQTRDAVQRGDLVMMLAASTGPTNAIWLADGRDDEAERQLASLTSRWTQTGFHLQHFLSALAQAQIALYRDDLVSLECVLRQTAGPLARSGLLLLKIDQIVWHDLVGRAQIAAVGDLPSASRRKKLSDASRSARRLCRIAMPWPVAVGSLIAAQVALLRNESSAASELEGSIAACEAAGMAMHAAAARLLAGRVIGGAHGLELTRQALDYSEREGVVAPERFFAMLVPALRALS